MFDVRVATYNVNDLDHMQYIIDRFILFLTKLVSICNIESDLTVDSIIHREIISKKNQIVAIFTMGWIL